jgi:hypothetical protein
VLLYPLYETAKPGQAYPFNFVAYIVLAWVIIGYGLYAYLQRKAPEKLAALGATMATDEIDFAEQHSPSLSSGAELPAPERPAQELPATELPGPDAP